MNEQKNVNKIRSIVTFASIGVLVVLFVLIVAKSGTVSQLPSGNGMEYDANSMNIEEGASQEEIVAALNEKVQEGMINISMNLQPVFETGSSKGNLLITNYETNRYPQYVVITRNDTGDEVYRSGGIKVGQCIKEAKLDVVLPAGTYDCTATFTQYDPETNTNLGSAAAGITITIKG